MLKHVDYLSTVSGGAYVGASLIWLLSRWSKQFDTGNDFPFGPGRRSIVAHLRGHGNYLTPGRGITWESLVGVILRGIVLNLIVWLPLSVALLSAAIHAAGKIPTGLTGFNWLMCLVMAVGGLFILMSVWYSLRTRKPWPKNTYPVRRRFDRNVRWLLRAGLGLALLGSLPLVHKGIQGYGIVGVLAGSVGGFWWFVRSSRGTRLGRVGVIAPVACGLILYGFALTSYALARYMEWSSAWAVGTLPAVVVISLWTGWFVNLNYISVHRYYRDRLMEAFMPVPGSGDAAAAATHADNALLNEMCGGCAPYLLINTNVVLVHSKDPRWHARGGDGFLLSPKWCGSTATRWVRTADYMQNDPLTLATAVAISGAAASPNTGFGGTGPMRNPIVALLMGLLNIRLGYWVQNPHRATQKVANHFRAASYALRGHTEERELLQVSDGGHFENLGVYELVRRRVGLIICCDAGADPEFAFADLRVLSRRIGTDFGVRIEFDGENTLDRIIPRMRTGTHPAGIELAERGYLRATIVYPDRPPGTLFILKTTMIPNLNVSLNGYKRAHPSFPDQSTVDQFFDEEQFEAYRGLGYEVAGTMSTDKDLQQLLQ